MRYVAAYLLAALGGNTNPSAKDIKAILGSVGIEADDERLNKVCCLSLFDAFIKKTISKNAMWLKMKRFIFLQVISELNGKDINEVMNSGKGL